MNTGAKIGVFLCKCGKKIDPYVDLPALSKSVGQDSYVEHCEILPYACLKPGVECMTRKVVDKQLNRLIIAGCEGRLMLNSFESQLRPFEFRKGQIDMINLRGHVAAVSDLDPGKKAVKAAKLIKASVAEMSALSPSIETRARINSPVMIVGGGIASFSAAQALARHGVDYLLSIENSDTEEIVRHVHREYPGERQYYRRLEKIVHEAVNSPHATVLPANKLTRLSGVTGDYTLTFADTEDNSEHKYAAVAIIACLDANLSAPGPEFGHDGKSAMIQSEMEEYIWRNGVPQGDVVFWINDYEIDQPDFAPLSARSAWFMATHILEGSAKTRAIILYNEKMEIPLSASERALNRKLGILWIPYSKALRPMVTDGYITICNLVDHVEHEIGWNYLVLSPQRAITGEVLSNARILGLVHKEGRFLTGHHAKVRPEMVGREETYMAGSARYPCNLHEALSQGRRAAGKTTDMLRKSATGELFVPRAVCVVDPEKCIGCGQCQELCDCGGIGVVEGTGGGLPRIVDPMVCTGGGTCAAACPYHALVLQNNSNDQREAQVAALANQLAADETMAIACRWGGLPAADIAGKMGSKYDPRIHIIGVSCVGQIDPCVMARAFKEGAPGLILIGCLPEECHHSYGVDHTWNRVSVMKKLLTLSGFDRRRIALAHADLNRPEEFVRTVESFTRTLAAIGPIESSLENQNKLNAIYNLIKYNTRIRHLLSAGLRRPWEDTYLGDQRHALDYDRDFSQALTEEFMQQRLMDVFREEQRPLKLDEISCFIHEDQRQLAECLWDMINNQLIEFTHENREAVYSLPH